MVRWKSCLAPTWATSFDRVHHIRLVNMRGAASVQPLTDICVFSLFYLQWRTGVNVLKRNSIRLAEVWMDEYKKYYYERIGGDLVSAGRL